VAERLRRSVERLAVMVAPGPVRITVSIGVATVRPGETVTLDEMLRRADLGLYRAKQNGRNCVVTV
jgi:diguanylate cyclase (GGDEF)-like protein